MGSLRGGFLKSINLSEAVHILRSGQILATPTDTVWGMLCDPYNTDALERMYQRKQRPRHKALQCLCASTDIAASLCDLSNPDISHAFSRLSSFWPGGLTLLVPAKPSVPELLRPEGIVGVRVPDDRPLQWLLETCNGFAACSSLNLSGLEPVVCESQADLYRDLYDARLDSRPSGGRSSTVYSIPLGRMVRLGDISQEDIEGKLK